MFDIGFWEVMLIAIVALLIVGPDRLPKMAHDVGLWIGRIRRYLNSVRADFEREVAIDEFNTSLKKQELERALKAPAEMLSEASDALRQQTTALEAEVKGSPPPATAPEGAATSPSTASVVASTVTSAIAEPSAVSSDAASPEVVPPDAVPSAPHVAPPAAAASLPSGARSAADTAPIAESASPSADDRDPAAEAEANR